MMKVSRLIARRHGGVVLFLIAFLTVSTITRVALLFKSAHDVTWDLSLLASFGWGVVYDLGAAALISCPLAVLLLVLPRQFFDRSGWRGLAHAGIITLLFCLLFGAVAEWVFWDEFGVRFNFIAVDYLVYTTEVIANVRESYPMPLIFAGILVLTLASYAVFLRTGWVTCWFAHAAESWRPRLQAGAVWCGSALILGLLLNEGELPGFQNNYNRELAKNGVWSLFAAFRANQLDYERFYTTMPVDEAFSHLHSSLKRDGAVPLATNSYDLLRLVPAPQAGPEHRLNVIQITVESLSASFLGRYGNPRDLTPHLNALLPRALVFDHFYATGTRTDRGMEALTLSVPPTPGRSLVKRPNNEDLFTLGSVFRSKGYVTTFLYGGYGYFDNMNHFFGENGYRIVDRATRAADDVTFANAWGACDEDLFRWTLREADRDHADGIPFFHFVMTTSNHRPYTFPEGRIDLPPKTSGRAGAVKYTDYAIGRFMREAEQHAWFTNTLFVIVADHCASSAGKAALPIQKYHIPLIIYAPGGQVSPGVVPALTSQVDYAPTLLGLLNWTYPSRFFGWNVLSQPTDAPGRAFIGNYQKLGLYERGQLEVLRPVRQSATFNYEPLSHLLRETSPNSYLTSETISYYQTASYLFKHGLQRESTASSP